MEIAPLLAQRPLRRIAVLRALHLGDLMVSVPALRALRAAQPAAHITLIGLPWAREFVSRFPQYLDAHLEFSGYPRFPERPASLAAMRVFLRQVQAQRFDLIIQMHGSGEELNRLVTLMGAPAIAGFHPRRLPAPGHYFIPWPEEQREIRRYLQLMRALGAPDRGEALEFPLREADHHEAHALCHAYGLQAGHFICLHPGARLATRRWPLQRYIQVARALIAAGHTVAITGVEDERAMGAEIAGQLPRRGGARCVNLAGATTLGGAAALLARARLLVANDTGVSHVAAALKLPSVIISCGGDAWRWAPLDTSLHRVLAHQTPCRPCSHETCPVDHGCALAISPARVIEAIQQQLERGPLPPHSHHDEQLPHAA